MPSLDRAVTPGEQWGFSGSVWAMDPERWRQITALFHDALVRDGAERAAFLDEACAQDEALREEVERLLAAHEEAGDLELNSTSTGLVGRQLGGYQVLEEIGRGGMGRVYRAVDSALGRDVAIKVLPKEFASNPERVRRFEREARLIAAVNHPKVATIHGLQRDGETRFLVLELVPGETLQDRLDRGPIPVQEALGLAVQIAEALEAAHDLGVVHRDLKPSNVKVTEEGAVKVLDFGLAKAFRDAPSGETTDAASLPAEPPTTREGAVLGTPPYMSPEQVGGARLDPRTDIWSFGVLLWEMLVGERPFDGETTAQVFAAVVRDEPDWARLPAATPETVRTLLQRCLTRERRNRLQAIGEARISLETWLSNPAPTAGTTGPRLPFHGWRWAAGLALLTGGLGIVALLGLEHGGSRPPTPLRRWSITPRQTLNITTFDTDLKVSPDGRHIVYGSQEGLWVQDLDQDEPRRIEDTSYSIEPFWSADSSFVGYFRDGAVVKVPLRGGAPSVLCPAAEPWGASWSPDGATIVFSAGYPGVLYEVSANGGTARKIVDPSEPAVPGGAPLGSVYRPDFLPAAAGPRVILFAFGPRTAPTIAMQDLDSRRRKILGAGVLPSYAPSGHIVYQETGIAYSLWAVPFALKTLEVTGRPFQITPRGRDATISDDGTLVYVEGEAPRGQLVWLNRRGEKVGQIGQPEAEFAQPTLSPDGRQLAVAAGADRNFRDAWVYDLARGVRNRLTRSPEDLTNVVTPIWSPRGDEIAFTVGNRDMVVRRADGTGEARTLLTTQAPHYLTDWSSDGRCLVYQLGEGETRSDIWYLRREEDGSWAAHPFLVTASEEGDAKLAPDGRYVAFVSNASGSYEVYVRPFPSGDRSWLISRGGGMNVHWSQHGRELLYVDGEDRLVSVPVSTRPTFSTGSPTPLFELPSPISANLHRIGDFDVSPDGSRFVVPQAVPPPSRPVIHVVQNWIAEFQGR
jgi:serine/threonine protein kinase